MAGLFYIKVPLGVFVTCGNVEGRLTKNRGWVVAKFRVYNIQLLPIKEGVDEVGKSGYRKLFSQFQALNKAKLRDRQEGTFHFRQTEDTFIGPAPKFQFPAGHVYGYFLRYRKVDRVNQLGTEKALFKAGAKTGVTSEHYIAFVFDTERHLFALEAPSWLPATQPFGDELHRMLNAVASVEFPNHELTVNGIGKRSALNKVFETATSYSVVDLDLTFRNGHDTEELLQEMKDTQTKSLIVKASAGKGGRMSRMPKFLQTMVVAAATGLGSTRITYFAPQTEGTRIVQRQQVYDSRDMPVTFKVNRTAQATQDETEFFNRIATKLEDVHDGMEDAEEDETDGIGGAHG